jgi:hypothetical protein
MFGEERRVTSVGVEPTRLAAAGSQPTLTTRFQHEVMFSTVAQEGLEPSRLLGHRFLRPAWLPLHHQAKLTPWASV